MKKPKTIYCPPFEKAAWDNKVFIWRNKKFIKSSVFCLFYFPLNFKYIIHKLHQKMIQTGVKPDHYLCLSDYTSSFKMDIYIAVKKNVPNAQNVTLSGTFFSKVYEGIGIQLVQWCRDFHARALKKGLSIEKGYIWHTTCPECVKQHGKNYVVLIGQVSKDKKTPDK